jgi:hypothetical protein
MVYPLFGYDLSPEAAINLILRHRVEVLKLEPVPVFVFVDEFRKLYDTCNTAHEYRGQDKAVLNSIGAVLSQPEQHTVMISTLESSALKEGVSIVRRP